MALRFIVSLAFAILVAVFAIQNSSSVTIKFLFAQFNTSQALIILISAIVGAVIVLFLAAITQIKLNLKIKNSAKTISKLEEENKLLTQRIEQLTEKNTPESNDKSPSSQPETTV